MGRISIVIPTLNAADALRRSLPALAEFDALDLIREVIIADGGSTDETLLIADASGARAIPAARGRGRQLAEGAVAARGDWLLFLHADTRLAEGWGSAVRPFVQDPANQERAGTFRLAFDDTSIGARRVAWLANRRAQLLGLAYGDQGLLISRAFYERLGGYKPIPLMEDVDLVRRIGRRRMVTLEAVAETSAERYRRDGFWLRPARNLLCLSLWFAGVPVNLVARMYR